MRRYAHWIVRLRWPIIFAWIVAVAAVILWLPKLPSVVSHQSTTYLPNSATSVEASNLANQVDPQHQSQGTVIVAIRDAGGLTSSDEQYLTRTLSSIEQRKAEYKVTYVQDKSNQPKDVASKFVSKDHTTEIAVVGLASSVTNPTLSATLTHFYAAFNRAPSHLKVYFTGDVPIQEADIQTSQQAASKTELVTVVLVLTILLLVFRSLLAPLVTLFAIGLSYLVSSGVVALAAEHGLPVSTFTQTFLIAILFGAGTDYTIILLNRFREELTKTHDKEEALVSAIGAVSKTVIYSSLTVFIAFAVLYFAKFGLYRSAVGVSIGVLITVITCLTFIPALMSLLGCALYWPRRPKPGTEHKPSRIWGLTSDIATRRPWLVLLVLVIVLAPIASFFSNDRTFNPMYDIPNARAVTGFHVIANSFGNGQAMPTTVVLQSPNNLRSSDGLATINNISRQLGALPGVSEVDSATQPLGSPVKHFEVSNQNEQAALGLNQIQSGLGQLSAQLKKGASGSAKAITGANQLANGSSQVTTGTVGIQTGAASLAANTGHLTSGAQSLASGLNQTSTSAGQLSSGTKNLANSQQKLASAAATLANAIAAYGKSNPTTALSPRWQEIEQLAQQLSQGTGQSAQASSQVAGGAGQLSAALTRLQDGASGLASGSNQLSAGASKLASGASQVTVGSQQVSQGLKQFSSSVGGMAQGLTQASSGASQLQRGVTQVQSFLQHSSKASSPGFYVPESAIKTNSSLKQAMGAYISPNGHIAKFTVTLSENPYSAAAIQSMSTLTQAAQTALLASPLNHGNILVGGTTATQANMNQLSTQDFTRTMTFVFVAVLLLLMFMLRSVLAPIYILISLAATYFVTMGILQMVAIHILNHPGVSWSVPFFVFLLLVALGVDYCIFLMSRFAEEYNEGTSPENAIRKAMRAMGNVVFSAAFIMAGTFGSMTVTGMSTMVEIGLAIIIGLFFYTMFLLAFFVPASVSIIGRAHSWPFGMTKASSGKRRVRALKLR